MTSRKFGSLSKNVCSPGSFASIRPAHFLRSLRSRRDRRFSWRDTPGSDQGATMTLQSPGSAKPIALFIPNTNAVEG